MVKEFGPFGDLGAFGNKVGKRIEPKKVIISCGRQPDRVGTQVTGVSKATTVFQGYPIGKDFVVVDEVQPNGMVTRLAVHISKVRPA